MKLSLEIRGIILGTVSGVAAFSDDPKSLYLKAGDVVECEIEKVGVLRNPVVSYKEMYGGKSAEAAGAGVGRQK